MKTCKFQVTGMTCAACQANVTKATLKTNGVTTADVNLLSGQMLATFDEAVTSENEIIKAVNNIGYGIKLFDENKKGCSCCLLPSGKTDPGYAGAHRYIEKRREAL